MYKRIYKYILKLSYFISSNKYILSFFTELLLFIKSSSTFVLLNIAIVLIAGRGYRFAFIVNTLKSSIARWRAVIVRSGLNHDNSILFSYRSSSSSSSSSTSRIICSMKNKRSSKEIEDVDTNGLSDDENAPKDKMQKSIPHEVKINLQETIYLPVVLFVGLTVYTTNVILLFLFP